jgi:predicted Fe-S protein YdhL (DUF1289 family)
MDAERGLCSGCLRTIHEIAAWGQMSDADKRDVWRALIDRQTSSARMPPASAAAASRDI